MPEIMLESIDLTQKLAGKLFKQKLPRLQDHLRELQLQIKEAGVPVILVFEGWDLTGKGGIVRLLAEQMDPRAFRSYPIYPALKHEQGWPFLRRFWLRTPARGELVIFYHSWYGRVLGDRVEKRCAKKEWQSAYEQINAFERQLVDDGALILKYWLHFSKKDQKKRLKKFAKDPFEQWQISPEVVKRHKKYGKYLSAVEEMLERTNSESAPWVLVPARDYDFAASTVFEHVIDSLENRLEPDRKSISKVKQNAIPLAPTIPNFLGRVNLKKNLSANQYEKELNSLQLELRKLQLEMAGKNFNVLLIYEGWDASGKGGNIHRLTAKLDPRWFEVYAFAAPTAEEKSHHYLWRFWKKLPPSGTIGIFDRSWYGRVLVERVEKFASPEEWYRAYREICEFEKQLTESGSILVKFWMHISKEEQLRRFKERQRLKYKQFKITAEDWRNRKSWNAYHSAVNHMIHHTSTDHSPWIIVEGNNKWWARVKTIRATVDRIKQRL